MAALFAASLIAYASGYALLAFAPCSWFGSSFEGACVYGAYAFAILLGLFAFTVSLALLLWLGFRRRLRTSPASHTEPPPSLFSFWLTLLVLQYVLPLTLVYLPGAEWLSTVGVWLSVAVFILASALLARYRARHPAASLLALIPIVGPLVVGVLLLNPRPLVPSSGA